MTNSDQPPIQPVRGEIFLVAGVATGVAMASFALRAYVPALVALIVTGAIALFVAWKWRLVTNAEEPPAPAVVTSATEAPPVEAEPQVPQQIADFSAITTDVAAIARGENVEQRIETAGRAARHAVAAIHKYVAKDDGQSVFFSIERTKYGANLKSVVHAGGSDDGPGMIPRHTPLGGFLWDVMGSRETVHFDDLSAEQPHGWQQWSDQTDSDVQAAQSVLIAPVCGPGHGIGLLWVESPQAGAFDGEDQVALETLRNVVESTFGLVETPDTSQARPGVGQQPEQIDLTPRTSPTPVVTAAVESATHA